MKHLATNVHSYLLVIKIQIKKRYGLINSLQSTRNNKVLMHGACIRTPQRHTFGAAFCVVWCHHFRGMPYMSGPCNDQVLWPQSRVTYYTVLPHTLVYWESDPNCWPLTLHCCDRILHMYTYTNTNGCYTHCQWKRARHYTESDLPRDNVVYNIK